MEIRKIEGLIIGEKSYGESSKIVDVITKDYGIISFLAKGAKKLKSSLRSSCQRFTYAFFSVSYKKSGICTLLSIDIIDSLNNIKKDIEKISYINYICELTNQVLRQSSNKKIYDIFINSVIKIENGFDPLVITNILEIKFLDFLGIAPSLDGCVICNNKNILTLSVEKGGFVCKKHIGNDFIINEKTIKIIRMLKYVDISKISKLSISENVKNEIDGFLSEYYDKYTGLYLKSKSFLKNVVKLK